LCNAPATFQKVITNMFKPLFKQIYASIFRWF
jgi:hypothetical protein